VHALDIRELRRDELTAAAELLARGMRDNPLHQRAFGTDADRRERALARFFTPVLRQVEANGAVLGAHRGATLVGVLGMALPGRCQPTLSEALRIVPALIAGNGPGVPLRVVRWTRAWARRDPRDPHWHLGPVGVDAPLQGQGIGGALLADFCARVDCEHALAYLETDKPENVRFYERFGFATVSAGPVLGVSNWFMRRLPR
jgi:GNAT superfamily N-acetyltransferase